MHSNRKYNVSLVGGRSSGSCESCLRRNLYQRLGSVQWKTRGYNFVLYGSTYKITGLQRFTWGFLHLYTLGRVKWSLKNTCCVRHEVFLGLRRQPEMQRDPEFLQSYSKVQNSLWLHWGVFSQIAIGLEESTYAMWSTGMQVLSWFFTVCWLQHQIIKF